MSDASRDLGTALRGWRDRTGPAAVGLPTGRGRRAAGLRREELAALAGVSVDYLTRLEQGRSTAPSPQVLAALARALRLNDAERSHLYLLAGRRPPGPGQVSGLVPPGVHRLVDQWAGAPLCVNDAAWNLLLWNPLWSALMGDASVFEGRERNIAWRHFTGLPGRILHTPEQLAHFESTIVGDLREATARYPADEGLRALIAELRAVSTEFDRLWEAAVVGVHESATKTVRHPRVGLLHLDCDVLLVPGSDLRIVVYTATPGTESADRLSLLNVIGQQELTPDRQN